MNIQNWHESFRHNKLTPAENHYKDDAPYL